MKTDPQASTTETFCIRPSRSSGQLAAARAALQNGTRVTVDYSRPLWVSPLECADGLAIVRSINSEAEPAV